MLSVSDFSPDLTPDPTAARAERRLALLAEMAEIGMSLLRRTASEVDDAKAAETFAKLSRAVRLTLALEEKTERFLAELRTGLVKAPEAPAAEAAAPCAHDGRKLANDQRKANALDLIVAISESEGESLESFEKLCDALDEQFAEIDPYNGQHLGPTLERLCQGLGLTAELASRVSEGWSAGYLAGRPRFNPWRERPPDAHALE
jgi:hypothetical protein